MLAVVPLVGLIGGTFERREREHFDVETVRVSGRVDVAHIIRARRLERSNDLVDDLGIDKRAIAGYPDNRRRSRLASRLVVAVENVVLAAAKHVYAERSDTLGERIIARRRRGRNDDSVDAPAPFQSFEQERDQRTTGQGTQHLAGKTRGTQAGLHDRDGRHWRRGQLDGLISISSSLANSAGAGRGSDRIASRS